MHSISVRNFGAFLLEMLLEDDRGPQRVSRGAQAERLRPGLHRRACPGGDQSEVKVLGEQTVSSHRLCRIATALFVVVVCAIVASGTEPAPQPPAAASTCGPNDSSTGCPLRVVFFYSPTCAYCKEAKAALAACEKRYGHASRSKDTTWPSSKRSW